jgi:tRNA 2-thiouridine synthesizing protein A
MQESINEDRVVDARDLLCPITVLATTKEMRLAEPGQVLKVLATDRGALADIPAWAEDTGNELLATAEEDGALIFWIRKASDA